MLKPLLLLDVDGVLNILGNRSEAKEHKGFTANGYRIVYDAATPERLVRLQQAFEIHWATTWEDLANTEIGPRFGLPTLPVCTFPLLKEDPELRTVPFGGTWKLRDVQAYVGDRPFAWVDDDLNGDAYRWVWERNKSIPTMMVAVYAGHGLTETNVSKLLNWAESLKVPA